MSELVGSLKRLLSAIGPKRVIGTLGALYVALAVGRAIFQFSRGVSIENILVVTFLIAVPGSILLYGVYWISRAEIDAEFYPDIAGWCLAGFGAMAAILIFYDLQPGEGISDLLTAPLILTALSSVAGFIVGIYDGLAKTRTRQLERQNRELEETQGELEETVTRLEVANRRLEHYREYTNHVLDAVDDVFYLLDEDGTLQRWNVSLSEVTGYSDAEIASMNIVEFFDTDDHKAIANAIAEGFESGSAHVEAKYLTKDGEYVPYEFAASTLENPDGETILAGIGRDLTKRKERERQLAVRARQQQAVADLGQLALDTDDLDELMRETSRKVSDVLDAEYCKVLDLDDENDELLLRQGIGWRDGFVGEATVSASEADSQAAHTLANDHPVVVEDLETEARFSGPELLTDHGVTSGISTIIGAVDKPWGILGTHDTRPRTYTEEDVNFVQSVANILAEAIERYRYHQELEQLISDLEESNERLEQFAYAASHDLQEPLRMISSYLKLIESRYEDQFDEDGREFLEFAVDGADRMRSMIEGLLNYSRVETRGESFEPIELDAVLEDVREDLQVAIEDNDATITTDTLPRVRGDPNQLRQLFQNLLENAIEYSGEEPPVVHVSARRNSTNWLISIRDEGIGIAPEDQGKIFEIFQRAHDRSHGSGTGIGLALCKRIIERHGGDIRIDSDLDEGTTVQLTLPAADEQRV